MSTIEPPMRAAAESLGFFRTLANPVVIGELAPCFVESFEQGSDRLLHIMYDEVAPALSDEFGELLEAGSGQLDVLSRVAELVGLSGLAVDRPLDDANSEALAQRIAWRSTARWAVLGLLWTLAEQLPTVGWSDGEWANAVLDGSGVRPRSRSGLPRKDEQIALTLAAGRLLGSLTGQRGRALLLHERPVAVWVRDEAGVAASEVRPIALVESAGELSRREAKLTKGDRILLAAAEEEEGFALAGDHDRTDGILTMRDDGWIALDPDTCSLPVVQGLSLLFER